MCYKNMEWTKKLEEISYQHCSQSQKIVLKMLGELAANK
jgi:hypothetical protein